MNKKMKLKIKRNYYEQEGKILRCSYLATSFTLVTTS